VSSELVNQLPESTVPIAEVLGDLLLRSPVEEHGTERLVAAVIRMRRPGEELPVRGAVHNGCSLGVSVVSQRRAEGQANRDRHGIEGDRREIAGEPRPRPATRLHLGLAQRRDERGERTDNGRDDPPGNPASTSENVSRFPLRGNRRLAELKPGQSLVGLEPNAVGTVVAVVPIAANAVRVIYTTPDGTLKDRLGVVA
jgi:hypothetical protein